MGSVFLHISFCDIAMPLRPRLFLLVKCEQRKAARRVKQNCLPIEWGKHLTLVILVRVVYTFPVELKQEEKVV